ncbi:hypothetical protein ACFL3U_07100 [Pseudomonadota bacterium]
MKLLSLVTVVVLLQVSLISQAAEVNKPAMQEHSSSAQIQVADKKNIITKIRLQSIGAEKHTKTNWGTTIVERKLHIRDGVFSLTLQSTKLYS